MQGLPEHGHEPVMMEEVLRGIKAKQKLEKAFPMLTEPAK